MNNERAENYIEEDEIDLRELFSTILKGKKTIFLLTVVVVILSFIYVLKLPNVYKSEATLIPTENKSGGLGGLGGLAAMAGISIGGSGGSMSPDVAFNSLLSNYEFMKEFVSNNKFDTYYSNDKKDENYVFALGFRGVYDFLKSEPEEMDKEQEIFKIIKIIKSSMSISSDKKTGLISVSYSDSDRNLPPVVIDAFLKDASTYLVKNNLRIIDRKLGYFQKELVNADGFELRQSISGMISGILQEKVMMKSKKYYQCDVLTDAFPSYVKDKTKPKRGLILVVSFITSLILGVFLVFFLEFIRKEKDEVSI